MARYDGLIIPRSYSEYINKTDSATLQQALQQSGVLDSAPTEDSVKAVKSGGVFDALAGKQPTLTFDNVPTEDSDNPVKSGGIYDALGTKQDTLTFDDTPTADSDNPVKSKGLVNTVPVDEVTSNNMHSVTSNAVAGALSDKLKYGSYDANTDRGTTANRTAAILWCLSNIKANMFTIRYADGYYYMYFVNIDAADKTVLEITSYNPGAINIFRANSALTTCTLVKSV